MTNNLGVAYAKLGVFDSAIHYIFKSVEEKQKLHVEESKLMSSWNNLATLAFRKKEYSLALEFANKCLETANREQDTVYMSHSYNILGVVYKYLKDYDQSISFYLKSLELSKSTGSKKNIGNVLGNLGILYLDLGDSTNAKRYIKEALKYSRYIQDKSVLANTQSKMAFFYYDYMQYDSAILMAKKSLEFASKTGYSIMEELNYKVLHQSYSKIGQFDSAYLSAVLYMQNHDSIYESESDKNYQELQTKYQTAEKEKEILELKYSAEIEKLHQLRMYWIGGSLIGIAGFFILLVVFKRRKDKIIYHQNQLVLKNEKALAHAKLEKSRLQEEELKKEIQYKSKQLTTHALNMMQKNTLMQEIQEELVMISNKAASENKPVLNRIKMLIKKNLRSEKDWDLFKLYFEDVNKDFYDELGKLSPELTSNDIKLCALLKLNMNIKESASVLNIEPASVKTARYKLRKKFNLSPEEDLVEFIRKIG
jgi:tetratricopeptide (TPR) repeat protein